MNHDEVREALNAEITALDKARAQSQDPGERAAASSAIEKLFDEVDVLNGVATKELVAKVDEIIGNLDEILEENSLDAASALGRTIRRLRDLTEDPTGAG